MMEVEVEDTTGTQGRITFITKAVFVIGRFIKRQVNPEMAHYSRACRFLKTLATNGS